MNVEYIKKLPSPAEVQAREPLRPADAQQKSKNDEALRKIFTGEDDRLLLIIGPCSADRDDAVVEYAARLRRVQEEVEEKILLIPRIYTNKPRTTGEGYKGMLHQPDPHKEPDLIKGVIAIRKLHIKVLQETGFSGADELLYPDQIRFVSDVLSYVAIGARSVEDQQHRLVASGISVPVGMKNPTGGDLQVMMNSVKAAQMPHRFIFADQEVQSQGNPLAHAILRGFVNRYGKNVPNYHYEDLRKVSALFKKEPYENPSIVIDCNHSNSGKKYEEQIHIAKEVLHSMQHSKPLGKLIKGLMIESYLEDGNQKPDGTVFGKSITDPCLGWAKTQRLIYELAEARQ